MAEPRLFLVTDDVDRASISVFLSDPMFVPAWAKVISRPEEIIRIPNNATAIGVWFSRRSAAEFAWLDRREMGGIRVGLDDAGMTWLAEWISRRSQAMPVSDDQPEAANSNEIPIISKPEIISEGWV